MKTLVKLIALALVMVAGSATAQITGTAHDLAGDNAANDDGRICVYCHTPHVANPAVAAPLWNRDASGATFVMYDSPTIDMTIAGSPQGVSLACLSCHDGSIAYDSLYWGGANLPSASPSTMGGRAQVGPDLTGDHPISVTYDNTLDTAFVAAVDGKVGTLPLFGTAAVGTDLECGTCHSVHDDTNGMFQRVDNTGSALCLTCHVK